MLQRRKIDKMFEKQKTEGKTNSAKSMKKSMSVGDNLGSSIDDKFTNAESFNPNVSKFDMNIGQDTAPPMVTNHNFAQPQGFGNFQNAQTPAWSN